MLSLYERYVPLTEEKPVPNLERTQAAIRDRAVSDARIAEQTVAELRAENVALRYALNNAADFANTVASNHRSAKQPWAAETCESLAKGWRALLTKVSR